MACPFSIRCRGPADNSESDQASSQHLISNSSQNDRRRKDSGSHHNIHGGWDRGPSLESTGSSLNLLSNSSNSHLGGFCTSSGMVQQRVNTFTHMTRSTSAPISGAKITPVTRRNRVSLNEDDNTPLLAPMKQPADPEVALTLKCLTEAVWSLITIPVSIF